MANTTALVVASPTPQPWRGRSVLLAGVVLLGERIFADDIVAVVPGMRVMTKADSLGMFTPGRMKFVRHETSETKIRTYDDTAIVTGRLRRARVVARVSTEDDWRFTKVYLRRDGRWPVVSFHASKTDP